MSISLYRKYRPAFFRDLVGQAHVATALTNALRDNRVGHAYLFSGPRGTGKTSTARILAKALNCLDLSTEGEPCGACVNCGDINDGRFLDLFELDAASNNSVADIRDVVEGVNLGTSTNGVKKVYLIDEVHMLSTAASNALLKTLEEPPDHVVFLLATTNPEKVLPTIRSRTQHFEFALLEDDALASHLESVLDAEKVTYDHHAVAAIARKGAGSARDALSALDQILAVSPSNLDQAAIDIGFRSPVFEHIASFLERLLHGDATGALVAIDELHHSGVDGRRITDEALGRLRDAYLLTVAGDRVHVAASDGEAERLRALAAIAGPAEVLRILDVLGTAAVDIRAGTTPDPRLALEVATVRIVRAEASSEVGALAVRVERLEKAVSTGSIPTTANAPAPAPTSKRQSAAPPSSNTQQPPSDRTPALGALRAAKQTSVPAEKPASPAPVPSESPRVADMPFSIDAAIEAWPAVLELLEHRVKAQLQYAQPVRIDEGDILVFSVPTERGDGVRRGFQQAAQQVREGFASSIGATPRFRLEVIPAPAGVIERAGRASARTTAVSDSTPADGAATTQNEPSAATPEDNEDSFIEEGYELLAEATETGDGANGSTLDSVNRLLDTLGGTVVEEVPRQ